MAKVNIRTLVIAITLLCFQSASGQVVDISALPLDDLSPVLQSPAPDVLGPQVAAPPIAAPPIAAPPIAAPPPVQPAPQPQIQTDLPDFNAVQPNQFNNAFNAPNANIASSLPQSLGVTQGSFSSAPTMIGDFFGGGFSAFTGSQTVTFSQFAAGFNISPDGGPGSPNSVLAFELGSSIVPDDIFTTGLGTDTVGGGDGADTFSILEPVPPSDAPTAPGPNFVFDGGTAVYTNNNTSTTAQPGLYNDGDQWFIQYSYTSAIGGAPGQAFIPVPSPGVSTRRVKLSENFSPEVRNRAFFNYNYFHDSFGGLGNISRYILGLETIVLEDLISIEARLPLARTFSSSQAIEQVGDRGFELGNAVLLMKAVLFRSDSWIWTIGTGVGLPLADDTRLTSGGQEIVRIENETVRMLPFTALMYRGRNRSALQTYLQVDTALNGDTVSANLAGGPLQRLGVFNDSTLLHFDAAYTRSLYYNRCGRHVREISGNAELHYTATVQDSDIVSADDFTFTNLKNNFNILNATAGFHIRLANNVVVTPAISAPLRDGLDRQFDYEAIVQVNYLR